MGAEDSSLRGNRKEGCITVILRHGGKFVAKPSCMYYGGGKAVFEGVNLKEDVSIVRLVKCAEDLGLIGKLNFYVVMDNSFKNLSTDDELNSLATKTFKSKSRVIEVFVDVVGVPAKSVIEEAEDAVDSDFCVDSDGFDSEDLEDDDLLWKENVDEGCQNEQQGKESSDDSEEEDVECDSDGFDEQRLSDDDSTSGQFARFNKDVIYNPEFHLTMKFENKDIFKKAITSHAINTKRCLYFKKNDKIRVHARCRGDNCDWACSALKVADEDTFQIRVYNPNHQCPPNFHVTNLTSKWLGQKHLSDFQCDPKRSVKGWRKEVMRKMNVNVSSQQAYRAKTEALKIIEGVPDLQYTKLWDYAQELITSNPGSTVVLDIDEDGKFSKMYVCFEAVKRGFKSGCKPFIGVDGCWLKGPRGGILLSAVSVDPNNCIYPLAYAVVSVENRETWEWFLFMLKTDFQLHDGENFTLMSDKQKGLIAAMRDVFPKAESRFCVRHMQNNFGTAGYRGDTYRDFVWRAAIAGTMGAFNEVMKEVHKYNEAAYGWLAEKDPKQWSKSHFSSNSKCDMLLNNVCESFNSCILDARDKPILTMLEWLRQWLMDRFHRNRDRAEKWQGKLTPNVVKRLRKKLNKISDCIPMKSNNRHYQIQCSDGSLFAVDLELCTCSCRIWELSGIPCNHALSAIVNQHWDPEMFVHDYHTVETYKKVYEPALLPIYGESEWASTLYIPPMPPTFGRKRGRPTKLRRKGTDEKLTKKDMQMKRQTRCKGCGKVGHTKKKCPTGVQAAATIHPTSASTSVPAAAPTHTTTPSPSVPAATPTHTTTPSPSVPAATPTYSTTSIPSDTVHSFDDGITLEPTPSIPLEKGVPAMKKMKVTRSNVTTRSSISENGVITRSQTSASRPLTIRRVPGSKKGKCVTERIRGTFKPPRAATAVSVTGSTANVTIRGLVDEDETEFEALLSQANSGVHVPGPSPWEQLHRTSGSTPTQTLSFGSQTLSGTPMFSTTQTLSFGKEQAK